MSETIVSYKGFDKDLKCRGFQYEVGKEYEEPKAKACESGFHACEQPLDVFNYYHPKDGSRFCAVEQSGEISKENCDSKVASSKIKIGAEIGIPGLVKAQIEYVKARCTNEYNAEPGKPATAGACGAATAGACGAATAGDRGAATAGDRGAATAGAWGAATSRGSVTVGKYGVGTVRGNNVKIRGGLGAFLSIAVENENNYEIANWKTFVIDGETYKSDTWYTLKDGQIVE
jgi:hypothetical protein